MNEIRPPRAKAPKNNISAIANRYDRVALVLQGGGALGAYQIGVYQALAEAECEPSWIRASLHRRHQFGDYRRQRAGKAAAKSRNFLVHGLGARSGLIRRKATFFAIFVIRQAR